MPNEFDDSVIDEARLTVGVEVGNLAKGYFGDFSEVPYSHDKSAMIAETQRLLDAGAGIIAEATFEYNGCICSVDILRAVQDGYEIVEVKSSTASSGETAKDVPDAYLHDMAYQFYVLINCGLNITKVSVMRLNKDYSRKGDLNLQELFILTDCTSRITAMQTDVPEIIAGITQVAAQKTQPFIAVGSHCNKPHKCGYKAYCSRNMLAKDTPSRIDCEAIRKFIDTIKYPLYHLDFETYQQVIPAWDGVNPYIQIPFQYSLHIQDSIGSEPVHKEFLAEHDRDPRREFAQRLCADIPPDSCIIAYNSSFERIIIKSLAKMFPDLSKHLMNLHGNMIDLAAPFRSGAYYCKEMGGSYSIKVVLPALCPPSDYPELDYKKLKIQNGSAAMSAYAELSGKSPEGIAATRKALLAYCRLDTLAMVRILEKLYEVILTEPL